MKKPAGLIGLGAMGTGIASTLRGKGYEMHVCDARPQASVSFARDDGVACGTPAEVGAACEVVVSVVVNAQQTEAVLFGEGGATAAMKPGSVFVMCLSPTNRGAICRWSDQCEGDRQSRILFTKGTGLRVAAPGSSDGPSR